MRKKRMKRSRVGGKRKKKKKKREREKEKKRRKRKRRREKEKDRKERERKEQHEGGKTSIRFAISLGKDAKSSKTTTNRFSTSARTRKCFP